MRKQLEIVGMSCAACSSAVEKALSKVEGITQVEVNLLDNSATLEMDESVKDSVVLRAIDKAGFSGQFKNELKEVTLDIKGMTCANCGASIERALKRKEGIEEVMVNLVLNQAVVTFNPTQIKTPEIIEGIEKAGFSGSISQANVFEKKEDNSLSRQKLELIIGLVFSFVVMFIAMATMLGPLSLPMPDFLHPHHGSKSFALIQLILTIPVFVVGRNFFTKGFKMLWHKTPNMDSLVAIGTSSAIIYSLVNMIKVLGGDIHSAHHLYFESAAVIIALVKLGKYFEAKSKGQTSKAIESLLNLRPDKAILIRNNQEIEIDSDEISIGDHLVVKPGQAIPVDAQIIEGSSALDESMLTGESVPVDKTIGDEVIMGTINSSGRLIIEAKAVLGDTKLAKIVDLVQQAQAHKAPIAKMADKVAGIFVPTVMVLSIITFIVWFVLTKDLERSLKHFISVLVIACPCALGLATPTAIMVGTGQGASQGIFIKSAEILEKAAKIDTAIFDKTGTLTKGEITLVESHFPKSSELLLLQVAASIENNSQHPLGQAIVNSALEEGLDMLDTTDFVAIHGQGVKAKVLDTLYFIGNKKLMNLNNINLDVVNTFTYSEKGQTVLYMSNEEELLGFFVVSDVIKEEAPKTIKNLKKLGIDSIMLTGDQQQSAQAIAAKAGVSEVIAEVLPDEKSLQVNKLQNQGHSVMMVGDGVNDAIALVSADIGVAIGSGTDVAIESADIVLMKNNLMDIEKAVRLSRATLKNIKQNLFWAFIYNIIGIPLAMGIFEVFGGPGLNPMMAGAAMAFSSVSVVSNALRLRNFK